VTHDWEAKLTLGRRCSQLGAPDGMGRGRLGLGEAGQGGEGRWWCDVRHGDGRMEQRRLDMADGGTLTDGGVWGPENMASKMASGVA
jgi:hypothetical protein